MTFSVLGLFILLRFLDYKPRYLYYISEVLFRDSCKSCKRNLGGGRVTDPILCLFIILRFLAQNHIFITFWKYSFMKVVRVVRGISRGGRR